MAWEIVETQTYGFWFDDLDNDQQDAVIARLQLLQEQGPSLPRPVVDRIEGSRHHNMKELRVSKGGALRILFIFDPLRQAVLLLGGNKAGRWEAWYREAIPEADNIYDDYLQALERGDLA